MIQLMNGIDRLRLMISRAGLAPGQEIEARLKLIELTALVNHGPVLALPWRGIAERHTDGKMLAAGDHTFESP